jgi:hypothetical protein
MKVKRFVAFFRSMFSEARPPAFDLNSATCLLLDVLHILSTMSYNRCTKIKTRNRLQSNGYFFFRPFALHRIC